MIELNKEETKKIKGGGVSAFVVVGISALITLIAGIVDGFVRPIGCCDNK